MSNDWKESEHLRQMAALCAPGGKSQFDSVMYWARDAQGLAATAVSYCIELLNVVAAFPSMDFPHRSMQDFSPKIMRRA